jgi:kynurenine formamidase
MKIFNFIAMLTFISSLAVITTESFFNPQQVKPSLWETYRRSLRVAKYVDLTHAIATDMSVWSGFGHPNCSPSVDPKTNRRYTYEIDGFEANEYQLPTDQLGTQLDPPAHWNPDYPSIDELPATFCIRPLVVISIVDQVKTNPGYSLTVDDVLNWENIHGKIPAESVVFIRSDWSKEWGQEGLTERTVFPGVSLKALQFLHLERGILLHGHEPLDTDATPDLESERWLLTNGYTQAEGVTNLDQVPETGALLAIGFAKLKGGLGGYARFIAICPPDWKHGVTITETPDSPLMKQPTPLRWDPAAGFRSRLPRNQPPAQAIDTHN